jgi:hypothetical protein
MDKKRLAAMRAALYGPAAGRTTAALAEALERLMDPKHEPVLLFVTVGPMTMLSYIKGCAGTIADALDIPIMDESKEALFVGPERRQLRFVTARQFLYGLGVGRKEMPSYLVDPGVLETLWGLRKAKP